MDLLPEMPTPRLYIHVSRHFIDMATARTCAHRRRLAETRSWHIGVRSHGRGHVKPCGHLDPPDKCTEIKFDIHVQKA